MGTPTPVVEGSHETFMSGRMMSGPLPDSPLGHAGSNGIQPSTSAFAGTPGSSSSSGHGAANLMLLQLQKELAALQRLKQRRASQTSPTAPPDGSNEGPFASAGANALPVAGTAVPSQTRPAQAEPSLSPLPAAAATLPAAWPPMPATVPLPPMLEHQPIPSASALPVAAASATGAVLTAFSAAVPEGASEQLTTRGSGQPTQPAPMMRPSGAGDISSVAWLNREYEEEQEAARSSGGGSSSKQGVHLPHLSFKASHRHSHQSSHHHTPQPGDVDAGDVLYVRTKKPQ